MEGAARWGLEAPMAAGHGYPVAGGDRGQDAGR